MMHWLGPIRVVCQPYWAAWKCDGMIEMMPGSRNNHAIRIMCGCWFRTEWVPRSRYNDLNDLLTWHTNDQMEKFHAALRK